MPPPPTPVTTPFVILIDRREAAPLIFPRGTTSARVALATGDYSATLASTCGTKGTAAAFAGSYLARHIALERKSPADAWKSVIGRSRARFQREWERMADIVQAGGRAAVLVETGKLDDLLHAPHGWRGQTHHGAAVVATYAAWEQRYGVPVHCVRRDDAGEWAVKWLGDAVDEVGRHAAREARDHSRNRGADQ